MAEPTSMPEATRNAYLWAQYSAVEMGDPRDYWQRQDGMAECIGEDGVFRLKHWQQFRNPKGKLPGRMVSVGSYASFDEAIEAAEAVHPFEPDRLAVVDADEVPF